MNIRICSSKQKLMKSSSLLAILFAVLFAVAPVNAQQYSPDLLKGMKYRLVGPFRGGRSIASTGVASDPNTYYMGAAGGGVWKSTNGGNTWTPLTDKWTVSSIGSVAVADSDPNVVYVGTGESCIRSNISPGDGVYKSTDAGKTWKNIGLRDSQAISKVVVHPKNADIVYVAALGHPWGPNTERGVFRTMDGGKTWEKVLFKDDKTGAVDIAMDPNNPTILFAALWEGWRTPWSMNSGGPNSGLYKSTDSGATWKQIQGHGWPEGIVGKIGVDVSRADSNRVYVILEALEEKGGVYVSSDGGNNWTHPTDDHRLRHRPWYYTHTAADPQEVNTVYVLNTGVFKSTDGGKTFAPLSGIPHGDHHDLWIAPNNNKRMVNSNDGGATVTIDGGESWTREDTLPTAQFYHVTADNDWPYRICGAQQDNSSVCIRTRSDRGSIGPWDWSAVGGGEAGYISVDPKNPDIVYAGEYFGILTRYDRRTGQVQNISVWPDNTDGWGAEPLKYRFQWTMPIYASRYDPNVVYYTGNVVFRSPDGGMSWDVISPDLTRNDKTKQGRSGGPITGENISMEYYNLVFSFAESPRDKNVLWAGNDDGLIHISRDYGKTWSDITPKEMPEGRVSQLDASSHDTGTAYVALDRHEFDDFKPYIWKTSDFGKTWKQIGTGIAENAFVRAVREDPKRKGLLYAGTEYGVWVSFDDGANWQPLQLNLPVSSIRDLIVKDDDLAVATHGRSFWVLDDLSPLRQLSDEVAKADVHLFTPLPAVRVRGGGGGGRPGALTGENPPAGVQICYYLKTAQKEEFTLEILDSAGKMVRKYSSKPKPGDEEAEKLAQMTGGRGARPSTTLPTGAGMQRFAWNFRYDMPDFVSTVIWDMGAPRGPAAMPGKYTARLTVAGKSYTAPIEVKLDPRVKVTQAELQKQFDLNSQIRDLLGEIHAQVSEIRSVREQFQLLKKRVASHPKGKDIGASADAIDKKMLAAEEQFIEVKAKTSQDMCNYPTMLSSKIAWLDNVVDSADTAPTKQSFEFFEEMRKWAHREMAKWKDIKEKDIVAFNDMMKKENIPVVAAFRPFGKKAGTADDDEP